MISTARVPRPGSSRESLVTHTPTEFHTSVPHTQGNYPQHVGCPGPIPRVACCNYYCCQIDVLLLLILLTIAAWAAASVLCPAPHICKLGRAVTHVLRGAGLVGELVLGQVLQSLACHLAVLIGWLTSRLGGVGVGPGRNRAQLP